VSELLERLNYAADTVLGINARLIEMTTLPSVHITMVSSLPAASFSDTLDRVIKIRQSIICSKMSNTLNNDV